MSRGAGERVSRGAGGETPTFSPAHFPTCPLSHLPTFPPAHFPTCPPSHPPTFPPAHFPTCPLSYLLTRSPAHFPTRPLSPLPTFPPAHPLPCPLSHLLTFSPAHFPTCSPAPLPTFSPAHLAPLSPCLTCATIWRMSKASPLKDLLRLLVLIVLLPLIIFLAGPLLVFAALLGRISLFGGVKITPGKRHRRGRLLALFVGLLLWGVVWGAAAWLLLSSNNPAILRAMNGLQLPASVTPTTLTFQPVPSATPAPPTPGSATPKPVATILIATNTPTTPPSPLPPTPAKIANTPTATPTATRVVPLASPSPTALPTATPSPPPPPAFTPDEETQIFNTLTRANNLLLTAIEAPTDKNLLALDEAWQGTALNRATRFARLVNQKYPPPIQASYSIIGVPTIASGTKDELSLESREFWIYQSGGQKKEVLNDYEYTLQRQGDGWTITFYQFKPVPLSAAPAMIAATEAITF